MISKMKPVTDDPATPDVIEGGSRRSICSLVSESRTAANGSGSGWLVVWGRWQDSRDRFSQRAREQVGPYWTFDRVVIGSSLLVLAGGVALTLV